MAQLELALDDVRKRIPWDGQSPRGLTRVSKLLFFKRERQKQERFFADPNQVDLFGAGEQCRPVLYRGAPLLVEIRYGLPFRTSS